MKNTDLGANTNELGKNYFAEENIVTFHYFFTELLKISDIPDETLKKIEGIKCKLTEFKRTKY